MHEQQRDGGGIIAPLLVVVGIILFDILSLSLGWGWFIW